MFFCIFYVPGRNPLKERNVQTNPFACYCTVQPSSQIMSSRVGRDHHFSMTAMATGCFLMFRRVLITNMTSKHQFSKISRANPRFKNFRYHGVERVRVACVTEPGRQDDLSLYLYSYVYKVAFKCDMKLDLRRESMSSASQDFHYCIGRDCNPWHACAGPNDSPTHRLTSTYT